MCLTRDSGPFALTLLRSRGLESARCSDAGEGWAARVKILDAIDIERVQLYVLAQQGNSPSLGCSACRCCSASVCTRCGDCSRRQHPHEFGKDDRHRRCSHRPGCEANGGDFDSAIRDLFNVMWRAWGFDRSPPSHEKANRLKSR